MDDLGFVSKLFYSLVSFLDNYGAATWNLRAVGLVTVFVLYVIRVNLRSARGIEWYSFIHAIVSGYGAFVACYLSLYAEELTGVREPLRVSLDFTSLSDRTCFCFSFSPLNLILMRASQSFVKDP